MQRPLHIASALARQIEQDGVRAYPAECCGILFGREDGSRRVIERVRPTDNVFDASQRDRRFAIDPLELMRAERDAAGTGLLVIGFYHSHPDHAARPSEFDRSRAWPFYSYVIVSIRSRAAVDMTSWVLDDRSVLFLRQEIIELRPAEVTGADASSDG